MNIFMLVKKDEEILDGAFDFNGRMVYSSLIYAMQLAHSDQGMDATDYCIMECELLDEKEIRECICQSLIGNRYSKLKVKWVASYTKKLLDAA